MCPRVGGGEQKNLAKSPRNVNGVASDVMMTPERSPRAAPLSAQLPPTGAFMCLVRSATDDRGVDEPVQVREQRVGRQRTVLVRMEQAP